MRARVLLLGLETQIGLTIIRELAQHGVEVHGLADSPHALGCYSRYLQRHYPRAIGEPELLEQLRDLTGQLAPCHVMAISENDIDLLNRSRSALPGVKLLVPEAPIMAIARDKSLTQRYASEVGIRVPQTVEIASVSELDTTAPKLQFPVICKWKDPLRVVPALARARLPLDKVRYCQNADELRGYLSRFAGIGAFPIIQEYCPGQGVGHFLFMHRGEVILIFQHHRLHEWPPEGGFSTLCEGVVEIPPSELMMKSIKLLQRMKWEGAAMVEYRVDPQEGRAWLMEVNGRFWGSLPLAHQSGAEFAWLTYAILGEELADARCSPHGGARCRNVVTDAKRLGRILFSPERIQDRTLKFSRWRELVSFVAEFFNLRTRYFVFTWKDPKPFLADVFFSFLSKLKGG